MSGHVKHKCWKYIVPNPTNKDWARFEQLPAKFFEYLLFGIRLRPENPTDEYPDHESQLYGMIELKQKADRDFVESINPHARWLVASSRVQDMNQLAANIKFECSTYVEHGRITNYCLYNFPPEIPNAQETRSRSETVNPRDNQRPRDVLNDIAPDEVEFGAAAPFPPPDEA